jgi:hypothetical protein
MHLCIHGYAVGGEDRSVLLTVTVCSWSARTWLATLTKLITDDNARALYDLPRATEP